ncbi:MAG TPA: response regulator [bacterium]|nr:response regulator [bacterium]
MAKILLIDDSRYIRTVVAFNLKRFGYEVIEAESGEEGIIAATTQKPDLILMDIVMPKADGFEVLKELKDDVVTQGIPVIMLTARGNQEDILRAIKMGACNYIVKPFEVSQVIAKLRKALGEEPGAPAANGNSGAPAA